MSKELEDDLKQALVEIESQLPEHQLKTLKLVFDKHLNLNQGTMLLDKYDYELIRSAAQTAIMNDAFPKYLGKNLRAVGASEARILVVIEATISYFIGKKCFNRIPKFDYRIKRNK